MPPFVVLKSFKPPVTSSPLMESSFSVSIPHSGSTVTVDSLSPKANVFPAAITRENQFSLIGMDELQEHDSPLSDSAEIEEVSAASNLQLQLGKPQKKKRWQKYEGPPTTREEVLRVSLTVHPQEERHKVCPAGFDKLGRLRHNWGHMRKEVQQAKAAHGASEEVQNLNSAPNESSRDHAEHQSNGNEQQARKNSISYTSKPKKPHRRNPERAGQAAENKTPSIETNRYGSYQVGNATGDKSKVHPSFEPQDRLLPRLVEGLSNARDPASQHTELDGMDLGTASGAHAEPAIIICSDQGCAKQQFDASYLDRYCGIDIKNARDKQQRNQFWLCPECAHKACVLNGHSEPVVHGSITREPKFGARRLDDDLLRDFLRQFSGLLTDYSAKAASKPTGPNLQMLIWDIPCVRDEVLNPAAGRVNQFVVQLRQLLDVPDGVTIKDKVDHCQLYGYRSSLWIRGILVSLFSEAVFHRGSPFESDDILHQSLEYTGLQSDLIESISQDCRTRTFGEDPPPKEFAERLQSRHQSLVHELNNMMMAVVGCDSVFDGYHRSLADLATELNAHISTDTKGTFREIRPVVGDLFDPQFHRLANREEDPGNFAGRPILVTTMVGIKYRLPGREWRVCSPAEVEIQCLPGPAGPRGGFRPTKLVPSKRPAASTQ